uniref:Alpha 2-HS glycoprotein n=1 Tax=Dromaius novaehollandiae TaxID=8790 RepID=A0A8C4IVJ1_DRONO
MKVLVALILLVQLPIHKAVPTAPPPPLGCDDPESEAAAELAVNYINDHSHHGYKFALNRIENVRVIPQKFGDILFLELDLLETECHILSPTPLENCTVRSFTEHAVEGDCDVKLQNLDGKLSVLASKCHSHADSNEDVTRVCPDCPLLANLNNTQVLTAVTAALNSHNSKTAGAYLKLLEIGRARIQVIARIRAILTCKQNTSSMVIAGVTYSQPGQDTSAGLLPNVVQGFTNHNLRLSHNNPFASESIGEAAQHDKVARPVGFVPPPPPCPGRVHHFKI